MPPLQTKSLSANPFESASENAIESTSSTNGSFSRNVVLTRSARMRKFKFYQFKPLDSNETDTSSHTLDRNIDNSDVIVESLPLQETKPTFSTSLRVESKQLSELDAGILELDKKITELRKDPKNIYMVFNLVNEKNDLLRRQMQLNILDHEKVLELESVQLNEELRSLLSKKDDKKTQEELDRQQYLNEQLVHLVNKRDGLVHHLDMQEKGILEDNALKEFIETSMNEKNRNCCIQ